VHALGTHLLVELRDCNSKLLNDLKKVENMLVAAAKEANATVIESRFHKFSPFGISGVVVIAESHLTIHTWPEYGYAAVDVFTCGDVLKPEIAVNYLADKFQSANPSVVEVKRGLLSRNGRLPHKPLKNIADDDRVKELQVVS
jgi:S-adenosylmethionine decarboxylase